MQDKTYIVLEVEASAVSIIYTTESFLAACIHARQYSQKYNAQTRIELAK